MNRILSYCSGICSGLILVLASAGIQAQGGGLEKGAGDVVRQTMRVESVSFNENQVVLEGKRFELPDPASAYPELSGQNMDISAREYYEHWLKPGNQVVAVFARLSTTGEAAELTRLELLR